MLLDEYVLSVILPQSLTQSLIIPIVFVVVVIISLL